MLTTAPLMAFIATSNAEQARLFYTEALGLNLVDEQPFALVFDAHGTTLRVQKVDHVRPAAYTALGWWVTDIRETISGLTERGVQFERFGDMAQDELGIWTAPDGTRIVWFKDPDGNLLSLTEAA